MNCLSSADLKGEDDAHSISHVTLIRHAPHICFVNIVIMLSFQLVNSESWTVDRGPWTVDRKPSEANAFAVETYCDPRSEEPGPWGARSPGIEASGAHLSKVLPDWYTPPPPPTRFVVKRFVFSHLYR
jgi:hypothetical protein